MTPQGDRWRDLQRPCFLGEIEPQGEAMDYLDDKTLILGLGDCERPARHAPPRAMPIMKLTIDEGRLTNWSIVHRQIVHRPSSIVHVLSGASAERVSAEAHMSGVAATFNSGSTGRSHPALPGGATVNACSTRRIASSRISSHDQNGRLTDGGLERRRRHPDRPRASAHRP